jgi:hypothetical protein
MTGPIGRRPCRGKGIRSSVLSPDNPDHRAGKVTGKPFGKVRPSGSSDDRPRRHAAVADWHRCRIPVDARSK